MAALLIAAHGLVAELSAARLDARSGAPAADEATRSWLQAQLAQTAVAAEAGRPSGSLSSAALAVLDAAERFRRAASVESDEAEA